MLAFPADFAYKERCGAGQSVRAAPGLQLTPLIGYSPQQQSSTAELPRGRGVVAFSLKF